MNHYWSMKRITKNMFNNTVILLVEESPTISDVGYPQSVIFCVIHLVWLSYLWRGVILVHLICYRYTNTYDDKYERPQKPFHLLPDKTFFTLGKYLLSTIYIEVLIIVVMITHTQYNSTCVKSDAFANKEIQVFLRTTMIG